MKREHSSLLSADDLVIIQTISDSYGEDKSLSFNGNGISLYGELFELISKIEKNGSGIYFTDKLNALKFTLMLPMLASKHGATGFNTHNERGQLYDSTETIDMTEEGIIWYHNDPSIVFPPYTREWNGEEGVEVLKNLKSLEPSTESVGTATLVIGIKNEKAVNSMFKYQDGNDAVAREHRYDRHRETVDTYTNEGEAILMVPKLCAEIISLRSELKMLEQEQS